MEKRLDELNASYLDLQALIDSAGSGCNNIPAIQPVINKQLTLLTASYGMRIHPFYKTCLLYTSFAQVCVAGLVAEFVVQQHNDHIGAFNLRRMHPVLGYIRPHKGIDLGCDRGTPVYATGDAVVEVASSGGNGGYEMCIRDRSCSNSRGAWCASPRRACPPASARWSAPWRGRCGS